MYIMHITYINVINAWNMLISLYYEIYLFFFDCYNQQVFVEV